MLYKSYIIIFYNQVTNYYFLQFIGCEYAVWVWLKLLQMKVLNFSNFFMEKQTNIFYVNNDPCMVQDKLGLPRN